MTDKPYSEMTDLKPCPFCGGDAIAVGDTISDSPYIMCEYCGTQTVEYPSRDEAVELWNTRAHDPASFEAGEKAMRARAARKAEKVGNFRDSTREELTPDYGIPRFDMLIEIIDAIRALPTGEKNAED